MPQTDDAGAGFAQIRPYQFAAALYCLVAAVAIAALVYAGRLPGNDLAQVAPFLIHLLLNGFLLWLTAFVFNGTHRLARSPTMRASSLLLSWALSTVGLILAGDAALGLTRTNAPALLLVIPGIAGWLWLFAAGGEERYAGAEVLEELPPLPLKQVFAGFGSTAVQQTLLYIAMLGGFVLLAEWYFILKCVLWQSARYELIRLVQDNVRDAIQAWPVIFVFLFIGLVIAATAWGPFLRQAFDGLNERLGHGSLTSGQRAIVQDRLQQLWDYANAPEQEKGTLAGVFLPALPGVLLVLLGFWSIVSLDELAAWFSPLPTQRTAHAWSLAVRDTSTMVFPVLLLFPVAWSLYRLSTDMWQRALRQALIGDLQSGPALDSSKIRGLRRALSREVMRGGDIAGFIPADYLMQRRRRASRRLHVVSAIALLSALLIAWRCLSTYTLVSDAGFEDVDFFTGRHLFYKYDDVVSVEPQCFLGDHGKVAYEVQFRDGRSADLLYQKDLPAHLPAIKRIDAQLRGSRAVFQPLAETPIGLRNARECVETLGKEYGDERGFAKVMHAD